MSEYFNKYTQYTGESVSGKGLVKKQFGLELKLKRLAHNFICRLSNWKNRNEFKRLRNRSGEYSLEGFDRLKCIYVHIPKTAGVSINKALFGNLGGGHRTIETYKKIFGPSVFDDYYTFTFVRNPYSRLLSAYRFLKDGGFNEKNKSWADENLSDYDTFDEFVKEWVNEENIWLYDHFKPQYSYVCDINLTPEVDFVGKFESINMDFTKVCRDLNIQNNLSVHNKGKKRNACWKHFYTDYSRDKIADLYQLDFQIFKYKKKRYSTVGLGNTT